MSYTGDFIGFSFNGNRSDDLGIARVSNGSRYEESLVPDFQDETVVVPGGNGTYFFKSNYTSKTFSINIAYDSLTEANFRKLRQVFAADEEGYLIFDEAPYKEYWAKVQSPPSLSYICFDEGGQRIYKGEGTIQFICYYPFARSVYKFLSQYTDSLYPNKSEWKNASGMAETSSGYDVVPSASISLYNPGDLEADFCAYFSFSGSTCELNSLSLSNTTASGYLGFAQPIEKMSGYSDSFVRINSKTNLVEGCDSSYKPTGSLYNLYLGTGDFFKIPLGTSTLQISGVNCSKIEYDYLYY